MALSGQLSARRTWFARYRRARVVRAEMQRRGSSESAYRLAMEHDPGSVAAVQYADEALARAALEHELAHVMTARLRWKMRRWQLVMPEDAACWIRPGEGGVLSARGIVQVTQQLREARRSRIVWWCWFLLSIGVLGAGAVTSL
jgi:hypothetical protein